MKKLFQKLKNIFSNQPSIFKLNYVVRNAYNFFGDLKKRHSKKNVFFAEASNSTSNSEKAIYLESNSSAITFNLLNKISSMHCNFDVKITIQNEVSESQESKKQYIKILKNISAFNQINTNRNKALTMNFSYNCDNENTFWFVRLSSPQNSSGYLPFHKFYNKTNANPHATNQINQEFSAWLISNLKSNVKHFISLNFPGERTLLPINELEHWIKENSYFKEEASIINNQLKLGFGVR